MTQALIDETPEKLQSVEEKSALEQAVFNESPVADFKKAKTIVNSRRKKLESIKDLIARKTYHLLTEKLDDEENQITKKMSESKQEAEIMNRPQALPKTFFEKRSLKRKNIRID
jgi:hypothetical protein